MTAKVIEWERADVARGGAYMIADLSHLLHRVMEGWSGSYDDPFSSVSNLATIRRQTIYI